MAEKDKRTKPTNHYLRLHRFVVLLLYVAASFIAYTILSIPAAQTGPIALLSSGAILATFGSAIATIGSLWTADHSERIALNVDILFKEIFKQEAWRRWPFLLREGTKKLFGGATSEVKLDNPTIPLHVGSHDVKVTVPTVQEDYFDLPVLSNLIPLLRFRTAAHTTSMRAPKEEAFECNKLTPMNQYMAYECLTDIWGSVFVFRAARYVVHFGAALTVGSAATVAAVMMASAL